MNRFCPTILEKVNGFREEVARLVDECQKDQVGKLLTLHRCEGWIFVRQSGKPLKTRYFQLPITEKSANFLWFFGGFWVRQVKTLEYLDDLLCLLHKDFTRIKKRTFNDH